MPYELSLLNQYW